MDVLCGVADHLPGKDLQRTTQGGLKAGQAQEAPTTPLPPRCTQDDSRP